MTPQEKVIGIARAEIGYREVGENGTKYATDYDYDTRLYGMNMNGLPWCDYFVDWCFIQAFGFDTASAMTYQFTGCSGASCAASASYYQSHNAFFQTPELGDQAFFNYSGGINHTGIVSYVSGDTIKCIEGNSGDMVKENTYSLSRNASLIAGFGRPKWSIVDSNAGNINSSTQNGKTEQISVAPTLPTMTTQIPLIQPKNAKYAYNAVKALQAILNSKMGIELTVDGFYGAKTQDAVEEWQRKHNLLADKEIGAMTWRSLINDE